MGGRIEASLLGSGRFRFVRFGWVRLGDIVDVVGDGGGAVRFGGFVAVGGGGRHRGGGGGGGRGKSRHPERRAREEKRERARGSAAR